VVSPARSTRGVDFFAHHQDGSRKLTIKVRALSRRKAVSLGATLDNLLADYVVVCRKAIEANPECFILTTEKSGSWLTQTRRMERSAIGSSHATTKPSNFRRGGTEWAAESIEECAR
jgi:hypothetical protein